MELIVRPTRNGTSMLSTKLEKNNLSKYWDWLEYWSSSWTVLLLSTLLKYPIRHLKAHCCRSSNPRSEAGHFWKYPSMLNCFKDSWVSFRFCPSTRNWWLLWCPFLSNINQSSLSLFTLSWKLWQTLPKSSSPALQVQLPRKFHSKSPRKF